jgi:glycosyltransferase involved in cell wall biosynthesis
LITLPYNKTKESSSAAIRFALAAQRPVLVTDLPIFSEFNDEVFKIRSADPDVIAEGIRTVLSSSEESEKRVLKATAYVQERTWDKVAKQYVSMLDEILEGRTGGSR